MIKNDNPTTGNPKQPLFGIQFLACFYFLGAFVLTLAMLFNLEKIGAQIAELHGLPALAGYPILLPTISLGALIGFGLYKRTLWGYWLTLFYLAYLLIVPAILLDSAISIFGNIIWPLAAGGYLLLKRGEYFDTNPI